MSESKLNLVASTLANSLGTTVIGHVTTADVVITMKYASGKFETVTSDESGSFLAKVPTNNGGEVTIEAESPDHTKKESLTLVIEQPAPVITAVISTQNGQRLLEGQVNQADVSVSVHFVGDEHVISLPVDKNLEFELVLPDEIVPSQIEVHATSNETGKTGRTIVGLGVTSKTLAMPALTDEMIAEYIRKEEVKQPEQPAQLKRTSTNETKLSETKEMTTTPVLENETVVDTAAGNSQAEAVTSVDTDKADLVTKADKTESVDPVPELPESRTKRRKRSGIRGFFARLFGCKG
ncbi:hypothetical protein [Weissella bombi]|uniref:Uncharacterized protein n=1 Tax=Weissella bombi TaxID=1505725 RepID=A0A1C4APP4_9LACO|nr:hypothetical protein [Weissella bombi]SCB96478.1 hypothetical protein GA0061074_10668 [Weissella bombi]